VYYIDVKIRSQALFLLLLVLLTSCSSGEPEVSANELVELGCNEYTTPKGLNYFTQAADLDEKYRELAKSSSALQLFLGNKEIKNLDAGTRGALGIQAYDDLATINSYC